MNWLITGGCGFIGSSLIARLLNEQGHAIRVVDNLSVGTRDDLGRLCRFSERPMDEGTFPKFPKAGCVELIPGDIQDEQLARAAAAGADVIVHLAAATGVAPSVEDPRFDCTTNVLGTLNYLEAAREQGVRRFVFASSGAPIGNANPPFHEELPAHPVSPYGASKLAGEGYCSAYFQTFGVETVVLRFGNVYGPGSVHKQSVVARFIKRALAGEVLEIYGDGTQTRDFIFIEDLVDAISRAAGAAPAGGEIFQIATQAETTVGELAACVVDSLRQAGIAVDDPVRQAPRKGDVMRNYSDIRKARSVLGWRPGTELADGINRTVRWFLDEGRAA